MSPTKFKAGEKFPNFQLPLVGEGTATLGEPQGGRDWQMVVVYRGLFCPMCKNYLAHLEKIKEKFYDIKIDIVAVSADSEAAAKVFKKEVDLSIPVAYGLSLEQMKTLGLYISNPRSAKEADHQFAEPGIFVVNAQGKAQIIDISNGPFARPDLETLVGGLSFIRDSKNNYPIRGTVEY